jgi:hypothetical protein
MMMTHATRAALAAAIALLCTAAATAAPLTVTKTPKVIYLFVSVTPAAAGKAPFVEIYRTDDQAACDAQAADWSARLAPNKFACLAHNQDKLVTPFDDPQ